MLHDEVMHKLVTIGDVEQKYIRSYTLLLMLRKLAFLLSYYRGFKYKALAFIWEPHYFFEVEGQSCLFKHSSCNLLQKKRSPLSNGKGDWIRVLHTKVYCFCDPSTIPPHHHMLTPSNFLLSVEITTTTRWQHVFTSYIHHLSMCFSWEDSLYSCQLSASLHLQVKFENNGCQECLCHLHGLL